MKSCHAMITDQRSTVTASVPFLLLSIVNGGRPSSLLFSFPKSFQFNMIPPFPLFLSYCFKYQFSEVEVGVT